MLFKLYHPDKRVKYVRVTWTDQAGLESSLERILDTDVDLDGLNPQQRVSLASCLILESGDAN
jgi:hypothetical protein